jgi:hypothetical protein
METNLVALESKKHSNATKFVAITRYEFFSKTGLIKTELHHFACSGFNPKVLKNYRHP